MKGVLVHYLIIAEVDMVRDVRSLKFDWCQFKLPLPQYFLKKIKTRNSIPERLIALDLDMDCSFHVPEGPHPLKR